MAIAGAVATEAPGGGPSNTQSASMNIVAISTPPGRGGIGVVRLSGPHVREIAGRILKFYKPPEWTAWSCVLAELPGIDQVIVSYFAAPRSYTAEDVVEIACHGAPVVLRHCVDLACEAGARLAEPGEFTLRAYMNGRLDLPRAEAVRDLIDATTLYQARVAKQQMEGSVSRRIAPIKHQLLELIALLEAGIDFAEDDISVAPLEEILRRLQPVASGVSQLITSFTFGKLVHTGISLAIVGKPNVGKSSLFNRILEQDRAIVTDIPGTTRDLVSEATSIGGIPVKLIDTAGIRAGTDLIESLGIERSYQAIADADITVLVIDLSEPLAQQDLELLRHAPSAIIAGNKCDLPRKADPPQGTVPVSALTGEGIEALRARLAPSSDGHEDGFITSLRHEQLLKESAGYLEKARLAALSGIPHEMLLLDLYGALRPIDAITGATTADDILNRIFTTFCIGK